MRWRYSPPKPRPLWTPWFAWMPVYIDGQMVWLEWVERTCVGTGFDGSKWYTVRLPAGPERT